jgi:hypothetical protein
LFIPAQGKEALRPCPAWTPGRLGLLLFGNNAVFSWAVCFSKFRGCFFSPNYPIIFFRLPLIAAQKRAAFLFWDKCVIKRGNVTILTSPGGVSGFLRRLH